MSPTKREKMVRLVKETMVSGEQYTSVQIRNRIDSRFFGGLAVTSVTSILRELEGKGEVRRVEIDQYTTVWEVA